MKKTYLVLFVLIIIVLTTAGCGSGIKNEKAYEAPKDQTTAKSSQGTTESGSQSTGKVTATAPSASVSSETSLSSTNRNLIGNILAEAKQGKVMGCDVVAGKTLFHEQLIPLWGQPDSQNYLFPKGYYAVYSSRRITVGVNKGEQIFEVRSYDNQYKELTRAELTDVLGKPDSIRYYKDTAVQQDILVYNVTKDNELLFILPQADKNNPEPHVDHISVVFVPGSINMMAN